MRKRFLTSVLALFVLALFATAQNNLKMQFNFENVEGEVVTDPISGVSAKLVNGASVVEMGNRHVLDLGEKNGYLNMTAKAGSVVKGLTDFTISVFYRVSNEASLSGAGYFLWCFSQSAANTQTNGPYTGYRLNAQRMAISTGGWGSEKGMEVGAASLKGRWVHMLYRQTGLHGELFVDGKKEAEAVDMPVLKSSFTMTPSCNWIGRAPFSADSYLKQALVSDFQVYDVALSDDEVAKLAAEAAVLENEYRYGKPGDFTELRLAVADCKTFIAGVSSDYAPNAISELQDAIKLAELVIAGGRASQNYVDEYLSVLQTSFAAAKAAAGYVPKQQFPHTDEHGFVHPGGIVSQEDIDRAKQLLADGDTRIKKAWDILCANAYSQADVATWPTWTVIRGGGSGQNYMNCARGAAMAYQNALRWKIGGTKANADAAVRIMMAWVNGCNGVGGDTNLSLAAGIYGHEFANAAELMRDYEGWSAEDFDRFKKWIVRVFYNPAIDFLRRRHDTWLNARNSHLGERPGHYWSNWGLCNALCVMSIGILCDDVHMYNQGVSFYKYDHVGTFKDRSKQSVILNDGCNEFIGNLVPVVLPDSRGPLGYLGQMQESGRDQGHALMALGLALDICQVGLSQGDDLFAYMNDRIAAGTEHVAALNFGGVAGSNLPWITYNYADCRGTMGAAWAQGAPNEGGAGEFRPYWDRAIGYYEGLRGIKLQYAEKASAMVCPDGGGGNYSQNSGGFDAVGFSTLTSWRPAVAADEAITPLSGDIVYKGITYKNQTNLGGLKYDYNVCVSKAIPADGSDIILIPQLPDGTEDSGNWQWSTGETTRQLTVKADRSYVYRVSYTAPNGKVSHQSFAIAVSGDADSDAMTNEITVDGQISTTTSITVLEGTDVTLHAEATTGWTNDYLWDNNKKSSVITVPSIMSSRTYTCQYANQSGAVSESRFTINVTPAIQVINGVETASTQVLSGATVTLKLQIPSFANNEDVKWSNGVQGTDVTLDGVKESTEITATYRGETYTFSIEVKSGSDYTYYNYLTSSNGYKMVTSEADIEALSADHYFVLASDNSDLMIGLADAPLNGNKALFFQAPVNPLQDLSKVFTIEIFDGGICLRNIDYDGLLLQTEMNRPDQLRTHDQPFACSWARLCPSYKDGAWSIENGTYRGNWLGLWNTENGFFDGAEIACNKSGIDIAQLQLFAISRNRFKSDYLADATVEQPIDATPLVVNPRFVGNGYGWTMTGTWGNQRYNGAVEVWHSTDFKYVQTIDGLNDGFYTVTCQMANGEGKNTAYLFATSGSDTQKATVTQSCSGSNFDAQRDRMAQDDKYGLLSVEMEVKNGKLDIGIIEPTSGTTWIVWDNFTLTYTGLVSTDIKDMETDAGGAEPYYTHDIQGRRVNAQAKGVYIRNGRKIFIR